MIKIKKVIVTLVTSMLTIGLVGCSSVSPSDTVENYLKNLKNGKYEDIKALLNENLNTEELNKNEEGSEEINSKLEELIKGMTYSINSEEINGDSATVNVKVNAPDIATVIGKYMQESFTMAFSQAFSGSQLSDSEQQDMYNEVLLKYLNETTYTDRTQDIKLTKKDGEWKIVEDNSLVKLILNIDPTVFDENLEDTPANKEIGTMIVNEPFNVTTEDGEYTVTIEGIRETAERNEFSKKEVQKVVILDYAYQNISFGQNSSRDLYIDEYSFQVLDDEGNVLDTYPIYDENRTVKSTPIGGKCKASATFGVTTDSKNLNITLMDEYKDKIANIILPIK